MKIKKIKRAKKAQMKMFETTFVLIALVFLFAILLIFYSRFQLFEIDRIAKQVEEDRANSLLNRITAMPELRCSLSFGDAAEINCIDTLKVLAFTKVKDKFADEFSGLSEVRIEREYPAPGSKAQAECAFAFDYPQNCGYWQLLKKGESRISFDTFVTLCTQKEAGLYECEVGKLIVGVPENG